EAGRALAFAPLRPNNSESVMSPNAGRSAISSRSAATEVLGWSTTKLHRASRAAAFMCLLYSALMLIICLCARCGWICQAKNDVLEARSRRPPLADRVRGLGPQGSEEIVPARLQGDAEAVDRPAAHFRERVHGLVDQVVAGLARVVASPGQRIEEHGSCLVERTREGLVAAGFVGVDLGDSPSVGTANLVGGRGRGDAQ